MTDPPATVPDAPEGFFGDQTPAAGPAPAGPPPDAPSWPALRWLALVETILCSGFPTQLLLNLLLRAGGWRPIDADRRLSASYITALSVLDAALLVGLVLLFLTLHQERPRDVLVGRRPVSGEALHGVVLIPLVFVFALLVMTGLRGFAPWLQTVPQNPLEELLKTPRDAWQFGLALVIAGGVREEVQRAFILHRFEQYLGGAMAGLLIFSVVFGAGHVGQGLDVAVTTGALGLVWGVVYLRRRSIVAPAVSHAGFDLSQVIRYLVLR